VWVLGAASTKRDGYSVGCTCAHASYDVHARDICASSLARLAAGFPHVAFPNVVMPSTAHVIQHFPPQAFALANNRTGAEASVTCCRCRSLDEQCLDNKTCKVCCAPAPVALGLAPQPLCCPGLAPYETGSLNFIFGATDVQVTL
jgi:hypothetical protein